MTCTRSVQIIVCPLLCQALSAAARPIRYREPYPSPYYSFHPHSGSTPRQTGSEGDWREAHKGLRPRCWNRRFSVPQGWQSRSPCRIRQMPRRMSIRTVPYPSGKCHLPQLHSFQNCSHTFLHLRPEGILHQIAYCVGLIPIQYIIRKCGHKHNTGSGVKGTDPHCCLYPVYVLHADIQKNNIIFYEIFLPGKKVFPRRIDRDGLWELPFFQKLSRQFPYLIPVIFFIIADCYLYHLLPPQL